MKNFKPKSAYRRWRKAIWAGASSGVVTGLILMGGANTAFADTVESPPAPPQHMQANGMHTMRRWNSVSKISSLAASLGLDENEVMQELKSGKTLKQILQENGIETTQLGKTIGNRKSQNKRGWKKGLNNE